MARKFGAMMGEVLVMYSKAGLWFSEVVTRELFAVVMTLFICAAGSFGAWAVFGPNANAYAEAMVRPLAAICLSGGTCAWPGPLVILASGLILMLSVIIYLIRATVAALRNQMFEQADPETAILIGLLWFAYNSLHWNDRPEFIRVMKDARVGGKIDDVLEMLADSDLAKDRPLIAEDFPLPYHYTPRTDAE